MYIINTLHILTYVILWHFESTHRYRPRCSGKFYIMISAYFVFWWYSTSLSTEVLGQILHYDIWIFGFMNIWLWIHLTQTIIIGFIGFMGRIYLTAKSLRSTGPPNLYSYIRHRYRPRCSGKFLHSDICIFCILMIFDIAIDRGARANFTLWYMNIWIYEYMIMNTFNSNNNYWIYWIYGTDLFDGKEFAIDGATQFIFIYSTSLSTEVLGQIFTFWYINISYSYIRHRYRPRCSGKFYILIYEYFIFKCSIYIYIYIYTYILYTLL